MKNSKAIIIKLAKLGILKTEEIPPSLLPDEDDEITYEIVDERTDEYHRYKVIIDEYFDEDLPISIMTKQYIDIKSIKNMIKFFVVLTVINITASVISALYIASIFHPRL